MGIAGKLVRNATSQPPHQTCFIWGGRCGGRGWGEGSHLCFLKPSRRFWGMLKCKSLNQKDHGAGLEHTRVWEPFLIFSDAPKVTGSAKLVFEILETGSGKWVRLPHSPLPSPPSECCWQLINGEWLSKDFFTYIRLGKALKTFCGNCVCKDSLHWLSSGMEKWYLYPLNLDNDFYSCSSLGSAGLGARGPGYPLGLQHRFTVWPWASHLPSGSQCASPFNYGGRGSLCLHSWFKPRNFLLSWMSRAGH